MDKNLVNIVRYIIDQISLDLQVNSIEDIFDGLILVGNKIYVCNTLHITIGKIVKDSLGNEYVVKDFEFNKWVEVIIKDPLLPFTGLVLIAPEIMYLHGSPASTNNEYLLINSRTLKKTPFIWLLESYEYDNLPLDSSVVASYSVRLFFMDWANVPKWKNDQHNELVIKPMENLSKAFTNVIENDYSFKRLGSFKTVVRPRFGVEVSDRGSDKVIINENLSGVDLSLTLELFNTEICCKN